MYSTRLYGMLAIERKRSKPRWCDKGGKKIILGTENKRVLVLN